MHPNDLKCGEIVDNFCYIPKSFCSIKNRMGGNCNIYIYHSVIAFILSKSGWYVGKTGLNHEILI